MGFLCLCLFGSFVRWVFLSAWRLIRDCVCFKRFFFIYRVFQKNVPKLGSIYTEIEFRYKLQILHRYSSTIISYVCQLTIYLLEWSWIGDRFAKATGKLSYHDVPNGRKGGLHFVLPLYRLTCSIRIPCCSQTSRIHGLQIRRFCRPFIMSDEVWCVFSNIINVMLH